MIENLGRRGQSSIEFLMTYGWAILIIMIVMIVAWQWGFFSIGETVEPGSFGFWGVLPHDYVMSSNGDLQVSFLNNVGANITILFYNASMTEVSSDCGSCLPLVIPAGESRVQTIRDLVSGSPGKRYEVFLIVVYNDSRTGDNIHRSSGKVWGNYEV